MHTVSSTIQVQQSDLSKQEMEATVIWGVGGVRYGMGRMEGVQELGMLEQGRDLGGFGAILILTQLLLFQIMKDCSQRSSDYCSNAVDVSNYLDLTSQENHDNYCLVFTFTYRDFSGGTLGLAWVATEASE